MNNRVILAVTNDLTGDQRVHKVAMSLMGFGYLPVLVGRLLPESTEVSRPYSCRRFRLPFRKGPLFYLAFNCRLFFYLLFCRAGCFLANDLDTLPAVFLAGRIRKIRVVYDSHEYFTEVPELVGRPRIKKIWEWIEKQIFPHLKSVYTVNGSIADIYSSAYGVPVGVVRNVPSAKRNTSSAGHLPEGFTNRPVIIYQGAVNIGRGLAEMISAMPLMPDFHLLIVGDGDIRVELEEYARSMDLSGRIFFTGKVPFGQLSWFTRQASLGMSLEQDIGLNYHYALPNKLFDYMHAGIPAITSNLPEIRKVIEDAGFGVIVNCFDPQYLSDTIKSMLNNPDQMKSWSTNALKALTNYTWETEEIQLSKYFPTL